MNFRYRGAIAHLFRTGVRMARRPDTSVGRPMSQPRLGESSPPRAPSWPITLRDVSDALWLRELRVLPRHH